MNKKGIFGFGIVTVIALIVIFTIGLIYCLLFGFTTIFKSVEEEVKGNLSGIDFNKDAVRFLSIEVKDLGVDNLNVGDLIGLSCFVDSKYAEILGNYSDEINLPVVYSVGYWDKKLDKENFGSWVEGRGGFEIRDFSGDLSVVYDSGDYKVIEMPFLGKKVYVFFNKNEYVGSDLVREKWKKLKGGYYKLGNKILSKIELVGRFEKLRFNKDLKKEDLEVKKLRIK